MATVAGAGVVVADMGGGENASGDRTVSVSATGTAKAQPDKAIVRVVVETTAATATDARTDVAENVTSVRSTLEAAGLNESQIRTVDYNLYRDEKRVRTPTGATKTGEVAYHASHELLIEVNDVEDVGGTIDTAVTSGATSVHDVRFTLSDATRERLQTQALQDAMASGHSKAETLANSADLTLGAASDVRTYDRHVGVRRVEMTAYAGDAGGSTDISSGPVSVTASVDVTYNATA